MSIEKNLGKQLDFQKELDEAGSIKETKKNYKELERGEVDDPWEDLGPNYEEQRRKKEQREKKEKEEEERRKKMYKQNDKIKRRNFDNRY